MKHYESIEVPAKTEQRLYKTTCDVCGDEIKEERYSAEEVTVKRRTGCSYPDGGSGQEVSVDMCGKCFDEKLVPWLESQGVKPKTEDWEW